MKEKIYEIYEVLSIASEWAQNPNDENATRALDELKESLIIKDYISIKQKKICLEKMLMEIKIDETLPNEICIGLEVSLLFNCLFAYVSNINYDIDRLYKDEDFYDLLYISGIVDYILKFCHTDYNRLENMVHRMVSFDNIIELLETMDLASSESIDDLTREFKMFRTETDPNTLKHLSDIMAGNDPILSMTKEAIEEGAFNAINNIEES